MLSISILTKNDLKITYKNIISYCFEGNKIKIVVTGEVTPTYIKPNIIDYYIFDDIKGIIIKKKGAKNAG